MDSKNRTLQCLLLIFGTSVYITVFVLPTEYTTKPSPALRIPLNQSRPGYFLVFVIPSHPGRAEHREAARKTWGNVENWELLQNLEDNKYKTIKMMFILGNTSKWDTPELELEKENNNDVYIVPEIPESRDSLRYKVQWGLHYATRHYTYQYLVKTDDDVTVHLPNVIEGLSGLPTGGLHYMGSCVRRVGRPPRRWVYCSGGGYVLSRDLITQITSLPGSAHRPVMRPEDVFMGWLVWNVNKTLSQSVGPANTRGRLSVKPYECGPLSAWFYHGYRARTDSRLDTFYNVIAVNKPIKCFDV